MAFGVQVWPHENHTAHAARSAQGRLDLDEAAEAIREEVPWLGIDRHHSQLPEWYWERRVV